MRLYRRLLWAYPSAFREEYGNELCLAFVDRYREARSAPGAIAIWAEAIGGILREAPREHFQMMLQDLRYALRILLKEAGVSATAVAILALGIGSSTLVFSLANGLMLRPLPYPQTDRTVAVDEYSPTDPNERDTVNFLNYVDFRARTGLLEDIGLYDSGDITAVSHGSAMNVPGAFATDGLFPVLGVAPLLGRTFTRADCLPTAPRVVGFATVSPGASASSPCWWAVSPRSHWRWRRWGSTPCCPTWSRCSGTKSASAWRWEHRRGVCGG